MMRLTTAIFFILTFSFCEGNNSENIDEPKRGDNPIDWNAAANSNIHSLLDHYWNPQQHYFNYTNTGNTDFHYWPQAHALDVLLDAYQRIEEDSLVRYMNQWYDGVKKKNGGDFYNIYIDDMEWNALAMLRAYNTLGDDKFKTAARKLWEDIQTGWSDVAGGGIMWKKNTPHSKNACSNGPAAILAARLYQLENQETDLEWAKKIYKWEKETLVDPASGAVWDAAHVEDGEVNINKDWKFTYNQGTFIGAATELYEITGDSTYLEDAIKTADFTLNSLTDYSGRLLKDEGGGDGGLFKGIFVRYLTQLIQLSDLPASDRKRYVNFLEHNAETLWLEGTRKPAVLFGTHWATSPENEIDLTTQLSGTMLIEAAADVL
ncbi:MAG: glycosyl hydrolase family 76 [Bacteroidales bacterium]|nr:glycosyl hydrolase family 76 [Bacteroidales bacterium]